MMIDLHAHTTASDGQYPPRELVRRARAAGLDVLAVTDHDTVAGLEEAQAEAAEVGLRLIPGIELSAFVQGREAHILGHFVDPQNPRLRGFSEFLRAEREKRMVRMLERARSLGLEATLEEVVAVSSGKNLGRPHLAQVLVARGYAADVKQAFDRYLGVGKPGYVERYKMTADEAIALIRGARGTATLAHAFVSRLARPQVEEMKRAGLAGLEVAHSDHAPGDRDALRKLARELDLVPTAGSDFHGEAIVPGRALGTTAEMDGESLARLEARRP